MGKFNFGKGLLGFLSGGAAGSLYGNTDDNWLTRTSKGIQNWWKAKTGQELSGAQREANAFNAAEADKSRAFEEEMYNRYESPQAMIRQYQEAGLNPALMYEGAGSPSAVGGNAQASSVAPTSEADILMNTIQSMLGIVNMKQQVDMTKAQIGNINAQTEGIAIDNANKEEKYEKEFALIDANIQDIQSQIDKRSTEVDGILQDIRESKSRVELNGTEQEVKESQKVLNELNAEKLQKIMPYVQAYERAQINLMEANTEQAKASAQNQLEQANLTFLNALAEDRLLSEGYYETLILNQKREGAVMVGNAIVGNLCKVADTAVNVLTFGFGSKVKSLKGVTTKGRNAKGTYETETTYQYE